MNGSGGRDRSGRKQSEHGTDSERDCALNHRLSHIL
jgi:hypothetical protein